LLQKRKAKIFAIGYRRSNVARKMILKLSRKVLVLKGEITVLVDLHFVNAKNNNLV